MMFFGALFALLLVLLGAGWLRSKINGVCPHCGSNKLQFQDGLFVGTEFWRCTKCKWGGQVKGGKYVE